MSWAAWLTATKTGAVGPRVPLLDGSKIELAINGTGTWTLVCDGAWLDTVPRRWWYPWASGALVCHRAADTDPWQPLILGPATEMPSADMGPDGETGQPVTLTGRCMRAMLARRLVQPRDWDGSEGTWDLQHQAVTWSGMSLGTIAERIAQACTARYAGQLPITYRPDLAQTGLPADDGHTRTYYAYNLSNIDGDRLIGNLEDVIGGPDTALRPTADMTVDGRPDTAAVDLWHGVEGQPQIPQARTPVWDATRPAGPVTSAAVTTDASGVYTRSWATGDGQDADILMDVRQNLPLMQAGMPLMEQVQSYSSNTTHGALLAHVDADLAAASRPTVQWQVTIAADRPGCRPGVDWWPGDRVRLITPATRAHTTLTAEAADRPAPPERQDLLATTISATADLTVEDVTVKMQEDQGGR